MQAPRSTLVRGSIAGVIGAATIALFFLVVGLARGTPFDTPAFLASVTAGRNAVEGSV